MTPWVALDALDGATVAAMMRSSKTTSNSTSGFCGPGQKSAAPRTATWVSFHSDRPGALLTGACVGGAASCETVPWVSGNTPLAADQCFDQPAGGS